MANYAKHRTHGPTQLIYIALFAIVFLFIILLGHANAQDRGAMPRFLSNGVAMDWWVRIANSPPVIGDHVIAQLSIAGFTHLRYPLNPRYFLRKSGSLFVVDCGGSSGFGSFMERQIRAAKSNGIGLVLIVDASNDQEALNWLTESDSGQRLADLLACLMQRAVEIDGEFASSQMAFGTINEPKVDRTRWNAVQSEAVQLVRRKYPDMWIMVLGTHASGINQLLGVRKIQSSRIIYEVHFYEPQVFTMQGALGVQTMMRNIRGVRYLAPAEHCDAVEKSDTAERCVRCDQEDSRFCTIYRQQKHQLGSESFIPSRFERVSQWAAGDLIYVGEYGVNRRLFASQTETEDRTAWLGAVAAEANKRGFGRAMYSLGCWFGVAVRVVCDMDQLSRDFKVDRAIADALKAN